MHENDGWGNENKAEEGHGGGPCILKCTNKVRMQLELV